MGRLRVGINGFGRIGRIAFRAGFKDFDIVGINDTAPT
ncbi:MAG: type I glyceraldehyde-3-phosphate dehydrogenase, partial [Bdellovibrionales bacterium]|nr:type I glyceraldehyde-3-phosphate dehydrogenase [Bdellovibrionales bacterium]